VTPLTTEGVPNNVMKDRTGSVRKKTRIWSSFWHWMHLCILV